MKTQQEIIQAGEYCGLCGSVPESQAEYNQREKDCWYCGNCMLSCSVCGSRDLYTEMVETIADTITCSACNAKELVDYESAIQ